MSERTHPGTITYVNEERGTEWSKAADDAPVQNRFADGVPIVRVVFSVAGNQSFIRAYGPDGQLLRSSVGFR